MSRPRDEEYYLDKRTEHVAQGDIFRDIPLTWLSATGESAGFASYAMLVTYTSGMMKQPPGTRDYKHSFRLVAPLLSFAMLLDMGLTDNQLRDMRKADKFGAFLYLPPYPGEFEESAVAAYRGCLVEHEVLEGKRVTQLQKPAAIRLQMKLATTFLGHTWDPEEFDPDLSDHWNDY
jgi:hypothetical protein